MASKAPWLLFMACLGLGVCSVAGEKDQRAKDRDAADLKALGSPNVEARRFAALRLAKKGKGALPFLPELLVAFGDPQLNIKQQLAEAFALTGPDAKPAVPALLSVLDDANVGLRQGALSALGWIKADPETVVPALVKRLDDREVNVRITTCWALVSYGPEAKMALPTLLKVVKADKRDSGWYFPLLAALSRVGRGDPRAAAVVVPLLEKEKEGRIQIIEDVGRLGPAGKHAIPQLVAILKLKERDTATIEQQEMAAWALGQMGEEIKQPVVDLLKDALLDKKNGIVLRQKAARALQDLGPKVAKSAIPALVQILRENYRAQQQAHEALVAMGETAVPELMALLKERRDRQKEFALRVLEEIGPAAKEATKAIEKELDHPESHVRF